MPDLDPAALPDHRPKTDAELDDAAALMPAIADDADQNVGEDLAPLDQRTPADEPPPYDADAPQLAAGGIVDGPGVRLVGETGAELHGLPAGDQVEGEAR